MRNRLAPFYYTALIATIVLAAPVSAQRDVRPAVGEALVQAQHMATAKDWAAAMVWIDKADAVPNKNKTEQAVIEQMRKFVRVNRGDSQP